MTLPRLPEASWALTPQSVPERGQWPRCRPIASTADGGDVVNLTEQAHPDNYSVWRWTWPCFWG